MYISKEEVRSPAVHLESLLMSLMIDAKEERDVATADIVGAYLLADMDDYVIIKLTEESADIMCKTNKSYKKYVTYERGKPVLYMRLLKALYGCMKSALLWYQMLKGKLEKMGFKLNPYDPCVANMDVEGSQCTICWYVDDVKISHKNKHVVDEVIERLEEDFGKMTVTRGKKHTYVGMNITLTEDRNVEIEMKDYLKEAIEAYGEMISGTSSTPAAASLFEISKDKEQLTEDKSVRFHHIVAKLLYVGKRARPDNDLAVSFLCTRVSKSTDEDWEKLRRLLRYV